MRWKKILSRYGLVFGGVYVAAFFLLVTFYDKFQFQTFPGDIVVGSFYVPFTSSAAVAAFAVSLLEAYKFINKL